MLKKILLGLVIVLFIACTSTLTILLLTFPSILLPGILFSLAVVLLVGLVVASLPEHL